VPFLTISRLATRSKRLGRLERAQIASDCLIPARICRSRASDCVGVMGHGLPKCEHGWVDRLPECPALCCVYEELSKVGRTTSLSCTIVATVLSSKRLHAACFRSSGCVGAWCRPIEMSWPGGFIPGLLSSASGSNDRKAGRVVLEIAAPGVVGSMKFRRTGPATRRNSATALQASATLAVRPTVEPISCVTDSPPIQPHQLLCEEANAFAAALRRSRRAHRLEPSPTGAGATPQRGNLLRGGK
jgi:hypothetical protein